MNLKFDKTAIYIFSRKKYYPRILAIIVTENILQFHSQLV